MQHIVITETENMEAHYNTIRSFFDVYDLPSARKHITTSLLAINSTKLWKGKCPADLVFFYQEFRKLVIAAINIVRCGCVREQVIISPQQKDTIPAIQNLDLYCGAMDKADAWLYIPKYLSIKEFYNPYKALKKANGYLENYVLDDLLNEIIQYALSYGSYMEVGIEEDTLRLNVILQKIIEAAYLVRVRTNE